MHTVTMSEALNEALFEEMDKNEKIILLGEEQTSGSIFGVTKGLAEKFGEKRVIDCPISENSFVGVAVGAAITGLRPVVEIMFADFVTLAMDQIVNHASKLKFLSSDINIPLLIRMSAGRYPAGGIHHSQTFESWFMNIPCLTIVAPSSPYDAKGLLKTALNHDSPVIFLEHKQLYSQKEEIPDDEYYIPFGKASIKREGKDLTLVATMEMIHKALKIAEKLEKDGINLEVIDPRTLKPLDIDTIINSVKKTGHILVLTEDQQCAGSSAEILAQVVEKGFNYLKSSPVRIGPKETPIPYSPTLEKIYYPSDEQIINAIYKTLNY